ncbi:MAG: amino acid adenylation domain-containing protein, partial [Planctomycetota bacterium]
MATSQKSSGINAACPAPTAEAEDPGPGVRLTPLQLAMVAGEMAPHRWQRDLVMVRCDLQEAIDEQRLRDCLARLVDRHESLRAALVWRTPGEPGRQVVRNTAEVPLEFVDLQGLTPDAQDQQRQQIVQRLWQHPIDVAEPSRCWATLLRLAPRRHVFVLTYQETVLDEESGKILIRELFDLYDAAVWREGLADKPPLRPVGELPGAVSFRDYLAWFTSRDQSENCRFWSEFLEQAPAPTPPPLRGVGICDRKIEKCCGELTRRLSAETTRRLRRWAADADASLNTVLLAAWAVVNAKHRSSPGNLAPGISGSDDKEASDVRFSAVFSERTSAYAHADSAVAMCFSVLPFVVREPERRSGGQLLRAVRDHEAELRAHSVLPDGDQASRRQFGHPSTQTLVFFDEAPIEDDLAGSRPGWKQRRFAMFGRNPYAIAMRGFGGERLRVQAWYNPGLYARSSVDCLLDQLAHVLEQFAATGDDTSVATMDLRPDEHRCRIEAWSTGPVASSEVRTLHGWFEHQAGRQPEADALVSRSETWTYGRLRDRSNQIARLLVEAGLRPGDAVGIHAGRAPATVAAVLGVMKAGGHYVPIDRQWPVDRATVALDRMDARYLVTDGASLCSCRAIAERRESPCSVIQLDGKNDSTDGGEVAVSWLGPDRIAQQPTEAVSRSVDPDQAAYVIFTSGSTGTPKGVRVSHRPVSNLIDWALDAYKFDKCDRGLWVTSLGFDLSVFDLFGLLAAGGSIRIADEQELQQPGRLIECLENEPITFWNSAPQALDRLRPYLERRCTDRQTTPRLRLVFLSGDWVPLDLPAFIRQRFPAAEVVALGGATEATVWSNHHRVCETQPGWRSVPYGKPIRNARYRVLDAERRPCGIGVPGELYIGGDVLAEGYAADPEQTASRFVPDPFTDDPAARMYRTGDAARWWPDGDMELLGRLDHQVKVRGFRVELGEIEAVLRRHPTVRDAVVISPAPGSRDPDRGNAPKVPGDPAFADYDLSRSLDSADSVPGVPGAGFPGVGLEPGLVAYVVPRGESGGDSASSDAEFDIAELKQHLEQHLPAYMVPQVFMPIESLPLTDNGKVDRSGLPKPEWSRTVRERPYVAPQTERQRRLAEVFRHVLQHDRIGLDDNFFAVGGDSLSALGVIFGAEDAGFRIDIDRLQQQTLAQLAAPASAPGGAGNRESPHEFSSRPPKALTSNGRSEEAGGPIPLVPSQRWLFDRRFKRPAAYAFHTWLRAEGTIDPDAIRQAWRAVVNHHEGLRLTFDTSDQGWTPRLRPADPLGAQPPEAESSGVEPLDIQVAEVDLRSGLSDDLNRRLDAIIEQVSCEIDMSRGPLPRLVLVRTPSEVPSDSVDSRAFGNPGGDTPGDRTFGVETSGGGGDLLLLFIPHVISDEYSARVVIADLDAAYRAATAGRAISLPPASLPFTAWARGLRDAAGRPELIREAEALCALPWDRVRPLPQDHRVTSESVQSPPTRLNGDGNVYAAATDLHTALIETDSRRLLDRSRELGLTVEAFLVEALGSCLADWTDSDAVLLAMTGNGRERVFDLPSVHRSVGYFSVIYPIL